MRKQFSGSFTQDVSLAMNNYTSFENSIALFQLLSRWSVKS